MNKKITKICRKVLNKKETQLKYYKRMYMRQEKLHQRQLELGREMRKAYRDYEKTIKGYLYPYLDDLSNMAFVTKNDRCLKLIVTETLKSRKLSGEAIWGLNTRVLIFYDKGGAPESVYLLNYTDIDATDLASIAMTPDWQAIEWLQEAVEQIPNIEMNDLKNFPYEKEKSLALCKKALEILKANSNEQ